MIIQINESKVRLKLTEPLDRRRSAVMLALCLSPLAENAAKTHCALRQSHYNADAIKFDELFPYYL